MANAPKTGIKIIIVVVIVLIVGLGIGVLVGRFYNISYQKTSIPSTISAQTTTLNYSLQSNYTQLKYNLSHPFVEDIYSNKMITIPHYQENISYYNSEYGSYYRITPGAYNLSFKAPNDGYLIIKLKNISIYQTVNTAPQIGTYSITIHLETLEKYNTSTKFFPCTSTVTDTINYPGVTGGGYLIEHCPEENATFLGWSVFPVNYTKTYIMPIVRGYNNISFANLNSYPINITFSATYVGEHYSNLTSINANYSTN